jgi:hypothetical protein
MAKKKVIHLITDSFEESAIETLQNLEPGPIYILSGESPDGIGIYLCDQPFTLEEAEAQHMVEDPLDLIEEEFDDIDVDTIPPLDELE